MSIIESGAVQAGRSRVTLQVIAAKLRVSTATVSLALRDSPMVAASTKSRVRTIAQELGYSYNRSAAALRTARTNIVAVAFHDITNPYFAELLAAVEETAAAAGKSILLGTYNEDIERQARVLATLREYRPDGMIVCAAGGSTKASYQGLITAGIPIVQLSRQVTDLELDFAGSDDAKGIALGLEHLAALGHRRIAFIGRNTTASTGRARFESYLAVLKLLGLPVDPDLTSPGEGTRASGFQGIQRLLDLPEPPTAAVCHNDLTAFGAMLGLRHRGCEAGKDFSIVGCDNVQESAQWFPALTTIHNRQDEMGRGAAELLIRRIEHPDAPARRIVLEPALIVRASTIPLAEQLSR